MTHIKKKFPMDGHDNKVLNDYFLLFSLALMLIAFVLFISLINNSITTFFGSMEAKQV